MEYRSIGRAQRVSYGLPSREHSGRRRGIPDASRRQTDAETITYSRSRMSVVFADSRLRASQSCTGT